MDIRALSLAETKDFGIVRMIVDDINEHKVDEVTFAAFPPEMLIYVRQYDAELRLPYGREMLDERYGDYFPNGSPDDYEPYVLGEDEYFVVGDNRYNSHDSRDWKDDDPDMDVGPIKKNMIVGHVRQVIWPLGSWRAVH